MGFTFPGMYLPPWIWAEAVSSPECGQRHRHPSPAAGARNFSERIFPAGFTLGRPHPEGPECSITVTPTPQSRLRMTTRPVGYESASIVLSILPVFLSYLITALRLAAAQTRELASAIRFCVATSCEPSTFRCSATEAP